MADGESVPSIPSSPTKRLDDLHLDPDSDSSPRERCAEPSNSDIFYQDFKAHEESFSTGEGGPDHKEFQGLGSGPLELSAELTGRLSRSASMEFDHTKPISLDNLPPELFLCICDFLDAKTVIKMLSLVCRYFHEIIQEDVTWKLRISKRFNGKRYPPVPANDSFNWKDACIQIEDEHSMWSGAGRYDHFTLSYGLSASVDGVHLMKDSTVLATGSRDRNLNVWDLSKLDASNPSSNGKECLVHTVTKAHKGWIWSLCSLGDSLCTGSWDMWIKLWDMNEGVTEVSKVKCKSAILAMHYQENQILAGGFDAKVYFIDPRSPRIVDIKRLHKKPVLSLAADDRYLVTGSEDGKISMFDRRAHKALTSVTLPAFPMSMSYGDGQLWVGDKAGCLHLFDSTYGHFDPVQTNMNIGHTGKVTGVHHSLGSIITCSTDKTIKVCSPTIEPTEIITLPSHAAEVAGIHYSNGVLASACCNGTAGLWRPSAVSDLV